MTLDDDSISGFVGESDLDVRAVSGWAGEVLTVEVEIRSLGVLGYTINWADSSNSWTIIESKVSSNILPILIVLVDLDGGLTSVLGWWSLANIFNI